MNEQKCPECGSAESVYPSETVPGEWWCQACMIPFDHDPDEGGDWSNDPTRRIERQERMNFRIKHDCRPSIMNYPGCDRPRRKNKR